RIMYAEMITLKSGIIRLFRMFARTILNLPMFVFFDILNNVNTATALTLQSKRKIDKYPGYLLIFLLVPLTRLLGLVLRRNHRLTKPPGTILFIKLMGLGSLLMAADSVLAVKNRFPDSRIILLTDQQIAAGILPFGLFDEIRTISSRGWLAMITDALRVLADTWRMKDLWVVDLEVYSKLTTVFSLMTIAINRFGFYLTPVFFRKYLNTHNVLFQRNGYLEDNYHAMAEAVTSARIDLQREPVKPLTSLAGRRYIAVNNTCSALSFERKLSDRQLAAICLWIIEKMHYDIALSGAPQDSDSNENFISQYLPFHRHRVLNLAGKSDFSGYYRFLREECACMVTIDSAPLHIAKAIGLPTVSVWGPTNPSVYHKVKAGEMQLHPFVYLAEHCSPCVHFHPKPPCGGNNFCITGIEAVAIIDKLAGLIRHLHHSDRIETDAPVFV
ncbi:MAG TPA: glycosyltransferase family 9 protein, partial [Chitinophagaceae bacterium]